MHGQQNDKYTEMHGQQNVKIFMVIVFRTSNLAFVMLIIDAKQVSRLSKTSMNDISWHSAPQFFRSHLSKYILLITLPQEAVQCVSK